MRFQRILAGALAISLAASANAKIATITISGSGIFSQATGIFTSYLHQNVTISATLKFSDGSDPSGDPELPSDYTGVVNFGFLRSCSSGYNILQFRAGSNCTSYSAGPSSGSVELYQGKLRNFSLAVFNAPDGGSLDLHALTLFDERRNSIARAYYTLTSPTITPVPEPRIWAMMIVGFLLVGTAVRGKIPYINRRPLARS